MNIAQIILPYYGGGVDIKLVPTFVLIVLTVMVLLLFALIFVLLYDMNKDEFTKESLGWQYRAMTIIIDLLSLIIGFGGCSFMVYLCINELISRL